MSYRESNTDETLVMLTLVGDQSAYEALVVRWEKTVISAAASVTHSAFMAEDAAQDAFVTAWMKLNVLNDPSKFGAWVCRIAKNCAKNMISRYRSYLDLGDVDNYAVYADGESDPLVLHIGSESRETVHDGVALLSERIRQIINMHYFDGLSIAEIADKLCVTEGTVKRQLYDGRKKLRKELCALSEELNDKFVKRVMKKVEELKSWQYRNSKKGFDAVYNDVLSEVEELPESIDKYHALADVLMRGWWWLPGEKNDTLFARIREAAELGKNDDVMCFICDREDSKWYGSTRFEFIRDKQIPRLEKAGFKKALTKEWIMLSKAYIAEKKYDEALESAQKALEILDNSEFYHALADAYYRSVKSLCEGYCEKNSDTYSIRNFIQECRLYDGSYRKYSADEYRCGNLYTISFESDNTFANASSCDGFFTIPELKKGESYDAGDLTSLSFICDDALVETPAGRFEGCAVWRVSKPRTSYTTYYKEDVGIVKQEIKDDVFNEVRELVSYDIVGGEGFIPFAEGNRWEYCANYKKDILTHSLEYRVNYADPEKVLISGNGECERLKYDENSWLDMILQIREEYWDSDNTVCRDVSYPIKRAQLLAETPLEKAHTRAAVSVARRILDTNPEFNPQYTEEGRWNFFNRSLIFKDQTKYKGESDPRFSFELKSSDGIYTGEAILHNDIYGILHDAVNCYWDEDWEKGKSYTAEFILWDSYPIKTAITCEDGGTITTAAGTFNDCMKITLDIPFVHDGIKYRSGKKEYFFARDIGIVRVVNYYYEDTMKSVYELTSYEGRGEGYMPFADGLMRHYDALDLLDGYVASAEYTYVKDDEGRIVVFTDRKGTRKKPEKYSDYGVVYGEKVEDELWDKGEHNESRLRHDINNFNILCHFLGRYGRYWAAPEKGVAWNKYKLGIMESLGQGKGVPAAWLPAYCPTAFRTACALFGTGENDEGYEWLEKAFGYYEELEKLKLDEPLDVGPELIYGGIKVIISKSMILLPDGRQEPLLYSHLFDDYWMFDLPYHGLTAKSGWEWFDGVRNDERYKAYIERALKLKESNSKHE